MNDAAISQTWLESVSALGTGQVGTLLGWVAVVALGWIAWRRRRGRDSTDLLIVGGLWLAVRVGLLAIGQPILERPGSDWLTVFGHVFNLTPLTEEEAVRLIREPVPYYRYDQEAVRLILAESQLIPHRIQLLCRVAVEEMLKEGQGRIKVKHVETAISSLTGETSSAGLSYPPTPEVTAPGTHRLAETRTEYQPDGEDEETE